MSCLASAGARSELGQDIRDVGLVERREREALPAEVVQRRADVDERRPVDDEESVVEPVRHPDRERVAVLRVEPLLVARLGVLLPQLAALGRLDARQQRRKRGKCLSTAESIAIPCSVNAYGMYFRCCPCRLFKVTICDLKLVPTFKVTICDLKSETSSLVNWNIKRSGKRSMFRFTA